MTDSAPIVAIHRCRKYEIRDAKDALETIWDAASMPSVSGKRILVKPNILFDAPPERAVSTHPVVLQGLLELLLDRSARPIVGDSPAIHTSSFSGEVSGLRGICRELDVPWADFLDGSVNRSPTAGSKNIQYPVTKHAAECDLIISVPKMKNHQLMFMTGAVKNLFGVIPAFSKSPYHLKYRSRRSFGEFLASLYSALPPVISVMDAVVAMEGPGPNSGKPRFAGLLLASADAGALDVAASVIMGYDPRIIPSCISMHRQGLTQAKSDGDIIFPLLSAQQTAVQGFEQVRTNRISRPIWDMIAPRLFRRFSRPQSTVKIIEERCISCGKCAKICPNGSASGDGERGYAINQHTCIRCYCCHEICPADAIAIGR